MVAVIRHYRKVIRIRAEDSPNVRYALAEQQVGREPTGAVILPGVLPWLEYLKRRATWDRVRQCIGLDGDFWEGAELLLFPPEWLNFGERLATQSNRGRKAKAIGIDTAEGGDDTAMSAVDEYGLIEQVSKKTPDTNVIVREAIDFMRRHGVPPEKTCFDRGGGGKQHADRLRGMGYPVKTVAFGEAIMPEPRNRTLQAAEKRENREERYVYFNRRAEMYGLLSIRFDPATGGYALPAEYTELRHELSVFPKTLDAEGRLKLPPKRKVPGGANVVTLEDLIGHSPDRADSLVIANWVLTVKSVRTKAGAR